MEAGAVSSKSHRKCRVWRRGFASNPAKLKQIKGSTGSLVSVDIKD